MADPQPTGAQPALETARLRLRPFRASDAPDVQRLAGARAVAAATLTVPHPYPDGAAEAWIATHAPAWAAGQGIVCAVTVAATDALVGAVGLARTPAHASAELGYWIGEPAWGQGFATEAAGALCAYAFSALDVHRIQARHFLHNPASGRVMQKLGMQREGVLRGAVRKWGRFEDLALYAVLAPEWAAAPPAPVPRVG
jgi:RimJ/RimL family protein N-acetyltransferase